jgi:hypothetical protein
MDECLRHDKGNKQEVQTMNGGLSDFVDVIAAWLCLVSVAFARKPLSMPSALLPHDGILRIGSNQREDRPACTQSHDPTL